MFKKNLKHSMKTNKIIIGAYKRFKSKQYKRKKVKSVMRLLACESNLTSGMITGQRIKLTR